MAPHIFTSPELLGTLPQALFFLRKMAPHIWTIIGLNKSGVYRAQSGVKNKKFTPICRQQKCTPSPTILGDHVQLINMPRTKADKLKSKTETKSLKPAMSLLDKAKKTEEITGSKSETEEKK